MAKVLPAEKLTGSGLAYNTKAREMNARGLRNDSRERELCEETRRDDLVLLALWYRLRIRGTAPNATQSGYHTSVPGNRRGLFSAGSYTMGTP